ncbi:hypothetical protein D187_010481 [Cystobacter fuscus DSM 2262]|uniref:Uncharacterized protein n=1 Tax=Cystobacter fuscus (strain ATCC 25194 / DSM 2262 / NBRC 100088 / M29) TaxID=1242864 RepID=S9PHG6_CYSF2|nr:hypothetical protein [Cystobacter fuscus]EPX61862.1 hypothetical protein D187_010481 [Cystobacter fuscus DSM 2262]
MRRVPGGRSNSFSTTTGTCHVQGSQGTRSLWFDEIGAGTTFADPAQ